MAVIRPHASVVASFLFASSLSLFGVVACSSSSTPSATSTEAGADPDTTKKDASTNDDPDDGTDTDRDASGADASDGSAQPTGTCPAAIGAFPESDYFRPMKPPTKGACSAADVTKLVKPGGGSWAELRPQVSAACASCVFADYADPSWSFVVFADADTGLTNYSGCNVLAGDTTACNKANNAWRFCTRKACGQCSKTAGNTCAEAESTSGQCKTFFEEDQNCPGGLAPSCVDVFTMIETYCGP